MAGLAELESGAETPSHASQMPTLTDAAGSQNTAADVEDLERAPEDEAHEKTAAASQSSVPPAMNQGEKDPDLVTWGTTAGGEKGAVQQDYTTDPLMDPDNPLGWPTPKKWFVMLLMCLAAFCVTCCSSMIAPAYNGISESFDISIEVSILGLSLFVIGLGLGPMFLGPLSEFYGRRPIYIVSYTFFTLLNLPVALANSAALFMVFRFLSGFAGSAFLSVSGGTISDLFSQGDVFYPMAVYTTAPFLGPVLGPVISGFINENTNWRWTFRTLLIWAGTLLVLLVLFAEETYAPKILMKRARRLRKQTGVSTLYAQHEKVIGNKSVFQTVSVSTARPFQLLIYEPMLFFLCLWSALLLGIVYLMFESYPVVFQEGHHFNIQEDGLAFLGIGVGMILALCSMPYWGGKYRKAVIAGGGSAPPEARLPMCMAGAILIPLGLWWFAFTTYPSVHWIVPIIASVPFGAGVMLSFSGIFTFTVDAYRPVAASAMSANSFSRSSFAAGFPLFATQMYHRLGPPGATALLAGLNMLMIPLPFLFYRYGARIRARSRFTYS